ncbi:LRAT domain-containing protein [Aphelenchoides besseyi]|nr:LRAT domain-containing protein [Aphelenchoides besseyi]
MVFKDQNRKLVFYWDADEILMELVVVASDLLKIVKRYLSPLSMLIIELRDDYFADGYFDWSKAKDEFFQRYFAYYQEEDVDLSNRPDLKGLVTEWMTADELVKHMKLGDLIEFKGTRSGLTLFHHWSICVRINHEVEARKRTTRHVRMLHLSRVDNKTMTRGDLFNYGLIFVSAKTLQDTHMTRRCRINNSLDRTWTPFEDKEIARHAVTWRGWARYNGTLWNCEHFVKCCRYGHGESYQTEMIATLVVFLLVIAALLSWIFLPAWVSLNIAWILGVGYYAILRCWRVTENVIFTFMRERDIPVSLYNLPSVYNKMTFYEKSILHMVVFYSALLQH